MLAVHLTVSVGWIGAVVAYLTLGATAARAADGDTVRGAWIAMETIGWYVIVPLAILSLVSGLLMASGTQWGLFRHYWVIFSLLLTVVAVAMLVLHMPDVSATAELARTASDEDLSTIGGDLVHPAIGLVILVVLRCSTSTSHAG